jgi:hypothetical protein
MVTKRREPVTSRRVEGAKLADRKIPPFKSKGPIWNSVRQQQLENCPLPAVLASICRIKKDAIRKIVDTAYFKARHDWYSWMDGETPRKRFSGRNLLKIRFKHGWYVRASPLLYHWGNKNDLVFARCTDGSGWAAYIEKAYVMFRAQHTYEQMDASDSSAPVSVEQILYDFVGRYHKIQFILGKNGGPDVFLNNSPGEARGNAQYSRTYLRNFLKKCGQYPTIVTTWPRPNNLIGNHTYVVTAFKNDRVYLWEAMRNSKRSVRLRDFWDEIDTVYRSRSRL